MRRSSSYPPQYGGYHSPTPSPGPGNAGGDERKDFADLLTPKTVVSLAVWLVMFGLGAGLSGLVLFIVYQGQVNNLRSELLESQEELRKSLEERIEKAPTTQESPSLNVSGQAAAPDPLKQLIESSGPAIVGVNGRDSAGKPVTGSGFVVNSTDEGTWVVTSYKLVAGVKNFNELSIRHRSSELVGEVYESDPGRDLALVIYRVPAERSLRFSRTTEPKEGDQVFAVGSARSKPFASGIPAKLTSVSPNSLGLDIEIPEGFVGGPLMDASGRVLGVLTSGSGAAGKSTASPAATPAAASAGTATPIELVCQRVIRCPSTARDTSTPGAKTTPKPAAKPAPPPAPTPPEAPPPAEPGVVSEPPVSNPNTADVPIG